jgi:hypothetical protein
MLEELVLDHLVLCVDDIHGSNKKDEKTWGLIYVNIFINKTMEEGICHIMLTDIPIT